LFFLSSLLSSFFYFIFNNGSHNNGDHSTSMDCMDCKIVVVLVGSAQALERGVALELDVVLVLDEELVLVCLLALVCRLDVEHYMVVALEPVWGRESGMESVCQLELDVVHQPEHVLDMALELGRRMESQLGTVVALVVVRQLDMVCRLALVLGSLLEQVVVHQLVLVHLQVQVVVRQLARYMVQALDVALEHVLGTAVALELDVVHLRALDDPPELDVVHQLGMVTGPVQVAERQLDKAGRLGAGLDEVLAQEFFVNMAHNRNLSHSLPMHLIHINLHTFCCSYIAIVFCLFVFLVIK